MDNQTAKKFKYKVDELKKILYDGFLILNSFGHNENFKVDNIITFKDTIFEDEYDLQNDNKGYPIHFINCHFKKKVLFNLGISNGIKLTFRNCQADSNLFFQGRIDRIEFYDCPNLLDIKINTERDVSSVEVLNSIVKNLEISVPTLHRGLILSESKANSLTFKGQSGGLVEIIKAEIDSVDFLNVVFQSIVSIKESKILSKLNFERCLFRSHIYIIDCTVNNFEIQKTVESFKTSILDSEFGSLPLELNNLNSAEISVKRNSNITLTGTLNDKCTCTIYSSSLSSLRLNKVRATEDLTFSDIVISPNGILSITESNLGKTKILNCTFSKSKFDFRNSQISEIFIADTDFPYTVSTNSKLDFIQARLVFGQLQKVFERHGDSVRHYEYQAREIEAYYKILKPFRSEFPYVNFAKINLWLNSVSNNFGKSWAKGILFTLIVGSIFFNLTLNTTLKYNFAFKLNSDMLGPYLKFMNPLRHFDIEGLFTPAQQNNLGITSWSHLFDFLGRILVAYGYYQTIQAFRRFGRK